ncbi:MAG: hypothetical protein K6G52_02920 [Treponemataceae bacterium]|nr:hypothetical protein [Treponemataceae bacterium]
MKKTFLSVLFCLTTVLFAQAAFAQDYQPTQDPKVRFRLFPTMDSNIVLQLDTLDGTVYMLNLSKAGQDGAQVEILERIENVGFDNGVYTMYPTKDKTIFILVCQSSGASWIVHWDYDKDKCYRKILGEKICDVNVW